MKIFPRRKKGNCGIYMYMYDVNHSEVWYLLVNIVMFIRDMLMYIQEDTSILPGLSGMGVGLGAGVAELVTLW